MTTDPIRGLLFDKDGTLFDFQATWGAWAQGFIAREAVDADGQEGLARALGFDLDAGAFRADSPFIAGTPDDTIEDISGALPHLIPSEVRARIDESAADATQVPVAELPALLDTLLGQGLVLGVATNDAEMPARAHLQRAGIADRFRFIAGFDSGFGGKPAPGQMLGFLQATGLEASQVAMVGDSTHDLLAGRAAGMLTVGVLTGVASHADLAPYSDVVLASVADLPGWLASR